MADEILEEEPTLISLEAADVADFECPGCKISPITEE